MYCAEILEHWTPSWSRGTPVFRGIPDSHRGTMRFLHNSCDKFSIIAVSLDDSTKKVIQLCEKDETE